MKMITAGLLVAASIASGVAAAPIDSATSVVTGGTLADFEGFAEGTILTTQYAGVTFSQDSGGGPQIDNAPFDAGFVPLSGVGVLTGSLEGGAEFPTVSGLIATFDLGQSAVEAFLSDTAPLAAYTISAFGFDGSLLESFAASATGRFVGFTRAANDIFSVQFGPSADPIDSFAIDDLRFAARPTDVPAPAAIALFGLGALGLLARRRQAR